MSQLGLIVSQASPHPSWSVSSEVVRVSEFPLGVALPVQEWLTAGQHLGLAVRAEDLGYDAVYAGEIAGTEVFALLGAIAASTKRVTIGPGITSIFLRSPQLMAMALATLESLAPGRVMPALGAGTPLIVESWHGERYDRETVSAFREYTTALRLALSGARTANGSPRFPSAGFQLQVPPPAPLPLLIGAFNPRMLRLAGELADGALISFAAPDELAAKVALVREGAESAGKDPATVLVAAQVNCYAGDQVERAMTRFRRLVLQYAVLPTHRAGFEPHMPRIDEMTELWHSGRRAAALELVDDQTVHRLCAVGDADHVLRHVARIRASGVDMPILFPQSLQYGDADSPATTISLVAGQRNAVGTLPSA